MTDTFKLETAACLWEAALDLRTRGLREVPSLSLESQVNPEADPLAQAIVEWFEGNGFCECRLNIVELTDECLAEWAKVSGTYDLSFDWDFVPAFLERKLTEWFNVVL